MKKIIALTLALLMSFSCFSIISFAEETQKTTEHLTEVPEGYIGVYTVEDLYCVRNDLTANYILMNDIDLSESTAEGGDWNYGGRGWNPIGSDNIYADNTFSGIFDGNGYAVQGMNIKISTTIPNGCADLYLGLFANVSGTIKKLSVTGNIIVDCTFNCDIYAGGISGKITSGKIENCINKVIISVSNKRTYSEFSYNYPMVYVGGITGYGKYGSITKCCNIVNLYAYVYGKSASYMGNTTYSEAMVGGIVADSYYSTSEYSLTVSNCFNSGDILAESYNEGYHNAFGIGESNNENCYNIGNITAGTYYCSYGIGGRASNCYNIGNANSFAYTYEHTNGNNYYLEPSIKYTSSNCFSLTEAQMKLQSMYSGWDFDTVWTMEGREDYPYPELRDVPLILPEDLNHKHEYTSEITKEATHLEEGETTYTCACGDSYTEAIAKLEDHTYTSEVTKKATHLEEGETTYTCACGDSYTEPVAKLKDHTYTSEVTKEATHLTEGETTYTCACGDSYTEPVAKLEGHTYTSEVTKKATHLEEGETTYTCACGDSYTEPVAKLEGHTYTSEVTKEATHLTEGETTYTCACGDSYTEPVAKLEGHTYKAVITEPTCTERGYTTYICACGDTYVGNYVGTKAHSYTSVVTRSATHLSEGVRTYTCSDCCDSYQEAIAKTKEHSYFVLNIVEPTCEAEGYTTYMCECGHTYNGDKKASTGHNYNGDTCVDCGESKIDNCSCNCHKGGFNGFIWKILRFFYKLFGMNKTCSCGVAHY